MEGKKKISSLLISIVILLSSCGGRVLPDYAPDVVCTVFHQMSKDKTYEMHGKLTLNMKVAGKEEAYTVDTVVVSTKKPYEIVVKTEVTKAGEDLGTMYRYYNEQLDKGQSYLLVGESWVKRDKQEMEAYQYAIPFALYFTDVKSFDRLAESKGVTVIEGETAGENTAYALQESGVLRCFALTALSEEITSHLQGMNVKAWVLDKERTITKVEVDMTEAVRSLISNIYGEKGPTITSCRYVIDQVELENIKRLSIPFDVNLRCK